jgi:hypothetical protein
MSDIALAKGEKFLEDNAKKDGVTVTASGLQYKVITPGTGKSPKATDTVEVHYEGTLINGKVFDSSTSARNPSSSRSTASSPAGRKACSSCRKARNTASSSPPSSPTAPVAPDATSARMRR